jgi:spore coat polysaccharide biosynthesis protein SpsF
MKDPGLVGRTIDALRGNPDIDYASTFIKPTFPEGLDCEAMRTTVLERAHREAKLPSEREHVTPYVWKHPYLFRLHSVEQARDLVLDDLVYSRGCGLVFALSVLLLGAPLRGLGKLQIV